MPGAAGRLLDVDSTVFLAFVEGVFRESEENAAAIDRLYEARRPPPPPAPKSREDRVREIERFARLTGGDG